MQTSYHPLQMLSVLLLLLLWLLLMFCSAGTAQADSLQSLLMPGKVIAAHKKYEEDCDQCHDTSDKKQQAELCLDCHAHKDIRGDIDRSRGFHGRLPGKLKNNCQHCHTEHEGRKANIVLLDADSFDHAATDFPLKGAHSRTACQACHRPGKKHSQASSQCYACHKKDDVHQGKQGKKCANCHSQSNWKKTGFKHDETDFPLRGAHKKTACNSCHLNQKYKDTPKACISCHRIDDVHKGGYGKQCQHCHNSSQWPQARFDHNRKTDFPLRGRHRKTACNSCHVSGNLKKEVPVKCHGCHKNDDSHKGRYGSKCQDCHREDDWKKSRFRHDKTGFSLLGKHQRVACTACHRGHLYKDKLESTCYSCHRKDDVHRGKQGKQCNNCHNEKGWHNQVAFDHDIGRFPLIGMHAVTACEECHLSEQYSDADTDCHACHREDDEHKARLGTACGRCHNPNAWDIWLFDHKRDTGFALEGAHEKTGCYDCHQTAQGATVKASSDCISCHRSQDIHNRQFGPRCGDCHNTRSFRGASVNKRAFRPGL